MSEEPGKYNAKNPDAGEVTHDAKGRLKRLLWEQGRDGQWNHSPGMLGIYNGLECAVAVIEGRPPVYKPSPDRWLDETENDRVFTVISNLMHLLGRVGILKCNADPNGHHEVVITFRELEDAQNTHRMLAKLRRAAPVPQEELKTFVVFGREYPVLADLGEGFFLVANEIMPAIACSEETEAGFNYIGTLETAHEDVPAGVRQRAIRVLMQQLAASPTYPRFKQPEPQSKPL